MAEHTEHTDDGSVHVHIHDWKLYAGILGALLFLTVITVAVSYVDIDGLLANEREVEGVGAYNLGVAILIAVMKASLVVTFFMHLKDDKRFNALFFLGSILFVGVFFAYTMNDTHFRGRVGDPYNGVHVNPDTGERAPGGIAGPIHGQRLEAGLPGAAEEAEESAEAEPAAAEAEEGSEEAVGDIVDEILGEEAAEAAEAEAAAADGEGDDFIDEILDDDGEAEEAEEAADEAPPEPVEEAAPARPVRRPRPRPAPAAEEPADPAPAAEEAAPADSQPEPEPEPEATE